MARIIPPNHLSADGYVEFTVGEMGTFWAAGLNHGNGAYRADATYVAGDVFRVAAVGDDGGAIFRTTVICWTGVAPAAL